MRLLRELWNDDGGSVLSAEVVMLGTLGVAGGVVGLDMARTAIHDEMRDVAYAIRSLDQSYEFQGYSTCKAAVAGSSFRQRPVAESLEELRLIEHRNLPRDVGPDGLPLDRGPQVLQPKRPVEGVDPAENPEKKPESKKKRKKSKEDEEAVEGPIEAPLLRPIEA
ncbi:MAG: hypothetical protein IT428_15370 [Planctomycetaceae bacterium]|nr:hypothetical protein [Planctomycetaceae bacterium]